MRMNSAIALCVTWVVLAVLGSPAEAAPLFEAPQGCTALQLPPDREGVQCYGSVTSVIFPSTAALTFSGTGFGPLWADQVTFEWDFTIQANGLGSIPIVVAIVNGMSNQQFYPRFDLFTQNYTGSFTLPYTRGEVLASWSILVQSIPSVPGSQTIFTPVQGIGLRLLATNQPPDAVGVPEPGSPVLYALALALVGVQRFWRSSRRPNSRQEHRP